jgi:cell division protein ZapA (FtsZ GTPase activity inhibitor)
MRTIEVKILGQRYKVRSDEGEDYIKSLAQFVNEQILQVQRSSQTVATHNVAILAALHIADDLFKVREENGLIKKEVRDRIRKLLKVIRSSRGEEEVAG